MISAYRRLDYSRKKVINQYGLDPQKSKKNGEKPPPQPSSKTLKDKNTKRLTQAVSSVKKITLRKQTQYHP